MTVCILYRDLSLAHTAVALKSRFRQHRGAFPVVQNRPKIFHDCVATREIYVPRRYPPTDRRDHRGGLLEDYSLHARLRSITGAIEFSNGRLSIWQLCVHHGCLPYLVELICAPPEIRSDRGQPARDLAAV